jgi:hypothetical protein
MPSVPLTAASVQIRSTQSAEYPVTSTISSCVSPDMAAPAIARANLFRASTSRVLSQGVAVDGLS